MQALRESKAHATLNEKKLQHTIQQKDQHLKQLAEVVDELKAEIDRCQTQLDADVKKEAEEKKKALKEFAKIEKEVKELRQATVDAQMTAQTLREKLEQTKADAENTTQALKEDLEQSRADGETTAQALKEELARAQEELARSRLALEEETKLRKELQEEVDTYRVEHTAIHADLIERTREIGVVNELRECERDQADRVATGLREAIGTAFKLHEIQKAELQQEKDKVQEERDYLEKEKDYILRERDALEYEFRHGNAAIETAQNHIMNYQLKKRDAELLIESLQDAAQKSEERIAKLEALVRGQDVPATAREEQKVSATPTSLVQRSAILTTLQFSPKPATPTTQVDLQHAASSIESTSDQDVKMTLEGTLECLRVQTEYILECHDDIFEETQRFRRALTRTPSNDSRAPLFAAS